METRPTVTWTECVFSHKTVSIYGCTGSSVMWTLITCVSSGGCVEFMQGVPVASALKRRCPTMSIESELLYPPKTVGVLGRGDTLLNKTLVTTQLGYQALQCKQAIVFTPHQCGANAGVPSQSNPHGCSQNHSTPGTLKSKCDMVVLHAQLVESKKNITYIL
eukprot:4920288-Amphidinium_carterae.1